MSIRSAFSHIRNGYVRFVEKQGFAIITVICVAVITATALWSRQEEVYVSPTPPVSQDISASRQLQQSLRDVAAPSPAPTAAPVRWKSPLDEISVLRPFCSDAMIQSGITGIWAIHDAVDLAANRGAKVYAMADGEVLEAGSDKLHGAYLLIDHSGGTEILYSGLALLNDYRPGDKVFSGDVIGYTGSGPLEETDLEPHLHLRATQDGEPVDPLSLISAP